MYLHEPLLVFATQFETTGFENLQQLK